MVNAGTTKPTTGGTVGEARINPKTGRPAGVVQGGMLLAVSSLPILGAVLIAPDLPMMSRVFADVPGSEALVPLVLVVPAVFIALFAPLAGFLVDKLGRKRVLLTALFAYAVLGTAPLWIDSLWGILLSRAGVGITEAFIITGSTALIADYFSGGRRNRYLGLQAVVASLSAAVFFVVGGLLGGIGWRAPFWLYILSVPIALLVIVVIWPTLQNDDGTEKSAVKLPRLDLRPLVVPIIFTFFGGVVFYVMIVELSYVLDGKGVSDPAMLGAAIAITSLATAAGAILFRRLARLGARVILTGEFAVAGLGFLIVAFAPSVPLVIVGACVASFASGALLPTLIVWAIARLPYEQRGRGTGAITSALFVGEFFCPLIVVAATGIVGSLTGAIAAMGVATFVLALVVVVVMRSGAMSELKLT